MRSIVIGECLVLLSAQFLYGAPANALMGADFVDQTVQRYIVAVDSTKGRCTGLVIAQNLVLTAAHCVKDAQNIRISGGFGGEYQTYAPFGRSPVAVMHPRYDPKQVGTPDLAVLKLATPLPHRFMPAFVEARVPAVDEGLIAAGYGKNAENDPMAGTVLRMVLLRASYRYSNYLTLTSTREDPTVGSPGAPAARFSPTTGCTRLRESLSAANRISRSRSQPHRITSGSKRQWKSWAAPSKPPPTPRLPRAA
jgi:hypothetical protein